ncbi:hypothetical protein [Rhodopila sp.]|uniref:aromatic-ring hydroxylase C-terminal domain-containing protein n=1 Tax=Rhodopila sp. TaxID=2480087 RepID=UPI003D0AECD0
MVGNLPDMMRLGRWGDPSFGLISGPTRSSRSLEAIIRDLIDTRDVAPFFAERVWGVSLHYDRGDAHPLAGRSAPDFQLVDGTKLGDLLRNGKGLFLDFDARPLLQALASPWSGRITYIASDAKDRLALSAVLVRPDGFVAWAGDGAPNHEEAAQAAPRWFGQPRRGLRLPEPANA